MADAHQVFISYPSEYRETADAIYYELTAAGFSFWMAPGSIPLGSDYAGSITDAIENSLAMVLVFGESTTASEHCRSEIGIAHDRGIRIVPFRIEEVEPNKTLEYYLSKRQWLDAHSGPLEGHVQSLRKTLRELIQGPEPAGPADDTPGHAAVRISTPSPAKPARSRSRAGRWIVVGAALAVIAIAAVMVLWVRPWEPRVEAASIKRMAFPLPEKPSIAVLAFDNLSGDAEQEYIADSMSESIIGALSQNW